MAFAAAAVVPFLHPFCLLPAQATVSPSLSPCRAAAPPSPLSPALRALTASRATPATWASAASGPAPAAPRSAGCCGESRHLHTSAVVVGGVCGEAAGGGALQSMLLSPRLTSTHSRPPAPAHHTRTLAATRPATQATPTSLRPAGSSAGRATPTPERAASRPAAARARTWWARCATRSATLATR